MWENNNKPNIRIIEDPERWGVEKIFEIIMAKNISNLIKYRNPQIQEAHHNSSRRKKKKKENYAKAYHNKINVN